MRNALKVTAVFALAAFFYFTIVEAWHPHPTVQAQENCVICKMAQQTTALPDPTHVPAAETIIQGIVLPGVAHPYLQFVSPLHGRAPPLR